MRGTLTRMYLQQVQADVIIEVLLGSTRNSTLYTDT